MARDRPAVIGKEGIEGLQPNVENVTDLLHRSPGPQQSRCKTYGSLTADANANVSRTGRGRLWHLSAAGVMYESMGSFLSTIILPVAVGAVAIVLLLGLINMMRGGSPNTSQRLMRLRVLLQFVAIVIAMLAVWAFGGRN